MGSASAHNGRTDPEPRSHRSGSHRSHNIRSIYSVAHTGRTLERSNNATLNACIHNDLDALHQHMHTTARRTTVGIRFAHGYTPLIVACKYSSHRIVQWIAQNDRIAIESTDARGNTALHHAAAGGSTTCIDALAAAQANLRARNADGATAAHFAAYHGRKEALSRLLHHGADIHTSDNSGKSLLMLAAFRGRTQKVSVLLRYSARVNARDSAGWTALMYAAHTGRVAICRELLEHAASRLPVDHRRGRNAAELAIEGGYYEVADMLQNRVPRSCTPSIGDVQMPDLHMPQAMSSAAPSTMLRPAIERALSPTRRSHVSTLQTMAPQTPQSLPPPPIPREPPTANKSAVNLAVSGHSSSTTIRKHDLKAATARTPKLSPIPEQPEPKQKPRSAAKLRKQALKPAPPDSRPAPAARNSKDPKPLQQKANRLARRDKSTRVEPHVPIAVAPAAGVATDVGRAPSVSERIKDTVSRASLSYLDSRTHTSNPAPQSRRLPSLASPHKRVHSSAWIGPYWRIFACLVTLWMPNFVLRLLLRKETAGKRQAWREKLALCFVILLITAIAAFISFGLSILLCHPVEPISAQTLRLQYGKNNTRQLTSVRGRLYDMTNSELWTEIGADSSYLFAPFPEDARKCRFWGRGQSASSCYDTEDAACIATKAAWAELRKRQTSMWMMFRWSDITSEQFVYNEFVYSLRPYIARNDTHLGATRILAGSDATLAVARSPELQALVPCWNAQLRVGRVEGDTVGCVLTSGLTISVTVILNAMILIKLICAVLFDWAFTLQLRKITKHFMKGNKRVPHVLVTVTCYNEPAQTLRATLDSIALANYACTRKLLFIVADGVVANTDGVTADILRSMVKPLDAQVSQPLPYMAVGEGPLAFNAAEVIAGAYIGTNGISVPCILVIKVGTQRERRAAVHNAGTRGKRDSQLIVLQWLRNALMNDRLTPLEFALCRASRAAAQANPDQLEYLLMVDADTHLDVECMPRLVAAMERDTGIMGLCGETKIANKRDSWVTRIQVYEYYISHHLSKAFESLWGGVTCLPGCCSMFRIYARKHGAIVPLIVAPDVVSAYSSTDTSTLHQKNLLLLGEDRYLTTVLLRAFPQRKLLYVPRAICRTTVPVTWRELLTQRRRWINSTIHNLLELVLVRDLCGTFCCSMQFLVLMDLIGNVVLPASVVFCYYLIAARIIG
ncbi:ATP-dependent RNA helicase, partial [Coemansia sp. RSA 2611]